MSKLLLIALLFYSTIACSQQNLLILKKGKKPIGRYWPGAWIAFQLPDRSWLKGEITRIQKDSFYMRPVEILYSMMRIDTVHYSAIGFSFADVYAMPKKGVLIDQKNGPYKISGTGGHVHWFWIKAAGCFVPRLPAMRL